MSYWTQIVATLRVDTDKYVKDVEQYVKDILKDAPEITGSEGPADIFVNAMVGHNISMSCDCDACKYGKTREYYEDGSFSCDADEDYRCPDGKYQTGVIITIDGSLRDRWLEYTQDEYKEFKKFLKKQKWEILMECKKITGTKKEIAEESVYNHYAVKQALAHIIEEMENKD